MSRFMRALLDEVEGVELPEEPPFETEPLQESDTVIGTLPDDLRKICVLINERMNKVEVLDELYDASQDHDGTKLTHILVLESELDLLTSCLNISLKILFVRDALGEGSIAVREEWQVVWSPDTSDDSDEGYDEQGKRQYDA